MMVARSSLLPSTMAAGASALNDAALMTAGVPFAASVDSAPLCIATIAVTSGIEALTPRIFLTISEPLAATTFVPESLMTCAVSSTPLVV